MPRGDKGKYTDKQKRKAEHIEEGYKRRGVSEDEAERRAWATVNKIHGGGEKSGSGRGKPENREPARRGGRKGGRASHRRSKAATTSRSGKSTSASGSRRSRSKSRS
jgi:plasmid stabilization system protein ParE